MPRRRLQANNGGWENNNSAPRDEPSHCLLKAEWLALKTYCTKSKTRLTRFYIHTFLHAYTHICTYVTNKIKEKETINLYMGVWGGFKSHHWEGSEGGNGEK